MYLEPLAHQSRIVDQVAPVGGKVCLSQYARRERRFLHPSLFYLNQSGALARGMSLECDATRSAPYFELATAPPVDEKCSSIQPSYIQDRSSLFSSWIHPGLPRSTSVRALPEVLPFEMKTRSRKMNDILDGTFC